MQFGNAFGHAAEHGELFVVRVYAGGVNALTGTGLQTTPRVTNKDIWQSQNKGDLMDSALPME